jgi:hypothetical protein
VPGTHNLAEPANYAALRDLLLAAASSATSPAIQQAGSMRLQR